MPDPKVTDPIILIIGPNATAENLALVQSILLARGRTGLAAVQEQMQTALAEINAAQARKEAPAGAGAELPPWGAPHEPVIIIVD